MSHTGLDKAVEDSKYAMKRYGVQVRLRPLYRLPHTLLTRIGLVLCSQPNLLIIPPQLSLYMALAPEEKLT